MVDDRFGAALCQRHLECIEHQRGSKVIGHRPTHHTPGPHIQHDGQVQKTAQVGKYVMSATQSRPGPSELKRLPTLSSARSALVSVRVVARNFGGESPFSPATRMSRATRLRPIRIP